MLLYGPPGTGKSRLAHAVASEGDMMFYSITSSDILSSFFGQSERMIRDLFKEARNADGRLVEANEFVMVLRCRMDKRFQELIYKPPVIKP